MKKSLSFLLAAVMLIASAAAAVPAGAARSFDDVEDGRWSAGAVNYAVRSGYMKGVGDGKFDPDGELTRAMAATVLWRREGGPAPVGESGFSDVPADEWYSDAVAWAKEAGVVFGVDGNHFDPERPITREALAAMLCRYASYAPVSVPERADLDAFDDADAVSAWAADAMAWAVEAALIEGTDGNDLDPLGGASREALAAIIERYDDTFRLRYNTPVVRSRHTEKPYPLVTDADLYVAPDGDDSGPGTFDEPLATFTGAVAKVREIKGAKAEGDIVVAFKAGNYGPVAAELHAEDGGSPDRRIVYCKYGDGEVLFDNGATVSEDEFLPITDGEKVLFREKFTDSIRKIDLRALIGEIPAVGDLKIFSDDGICTVARFPNKYGDGSDCFIESAKTYDEDASLSTLLITNSLLARRMASYPAESVAQMLIYGYIVRGFRKDTFTVESYDAENSLLRVGYGSSEEFNRKLRYGWDDGGDGARMVVLNVPTELDARGEYWVDRTTGTLYVFDPRGEYHIPTPQGEKRVRGVDYETIEGNHRLTEQYCAIYAEETGYVTLRGLSFRDAMDGFIIGYKTSGFEIDRCSFECCTGRDQVLFEKSLPDEPLGLRVTDCEFDLCVGRHVFVFDEAAGPNRFTDRSDVLIDNCLFSHANLEYDVEGAITLHCCSGGTVSHNRFENCHRYAVSFFGSCDVIVEYNDFDSAMTDSDDGGVTYGFSDMIGNNVIRYNLYNTVSGGSVGRLSHYCDNADCGTLMYSNLIYDGGVVCYHGAGRDNVLSNNVMIGENVGSTCGSLTGEVVEDGVEKTVVTGDWMYGYVMNAWRTVLGYAETVPGYAEALESRRPGALSLSLDPDDAGLKSHVMAPTNTFTGNLFVNDGAKVRLEFVGNAEQYCTVEGNTAYTFTENPVFVNPTVGDYRIREGADFPDIHFEEIGRY